MDSRRRKRSCARCARAKRRCTGGNPCRRCVRQGKDCENQQQCPQLDEIAVAIRHDDQLLHSDHAEIFLAEHNPLVPSDDHTWRRYPTTFMPATTFDPSMWESEDHFPTIANPATIQLQSPGLPDPSLDMALTSSLMSTEPINTFAIPSITPAQKSRIGYPIQVIKGAPAMFACGNQTPWSHELLWEDAMPNCLQEAQAACAFHTCRNSINDAFVSRHVQIKLSELLTLPRAIDQVQALAQIQAAILYLAILLSSRHNLQLHTQTSILLLHLEASTLTLRSFLQDLPIPDSPLHLPIHPLADTRDFFKKWIWYESAVRTYGIACFLLVATYILRGEGSRCSLHSSSTSYVDLSFPNSRVTLLPTLWDAKSALDFATAWNNDVDAHSEVFGVDFTDILQKTDWVRLDDFGKMLLISVLGEEEVIAWRMMSKD